MKTAAVLAGGGLALAAALVLSRPPYRVAVVPLDWDADLNAERVHSLLVDKLRRLGAARVEVPEKFGAPIVATSNSRLLAPGSRLVVDDGAIIATVMDASEIF